MSLVDSDSVADRHTIDADVCIVGGGAAGLAVATALEPTALRTVMLESERLADTTSEWYGRIGPLDEIDFEQRDWVPLSGWPIPASAVSDYAPRAARFFGLRRPEALERGHWANHAAFRALDGSGLRAGVFLWPHRVRTSRLHVPALRRSRSVQVIERAHATRLEAAGHGSTVAAVAVRGRHGNEFRVRARAYVLACGGLENARLLLLSPGADGAALGNQHGAVGRYYMNHPRGAGIAVLHPSARRGARVRGLTEHSNRRARGRTQIFVRLDPELQRRERLLNCCSFLYPAGPPGRSPGTPGRAPARLGLRLAGRPLAVDRFVAIDQAEQVPERESRVVLGSRRDRFGDPALDIHWRIGPETTRSLKRLHELLSERVDAAGIGTLESTLLDDPDSEPAYTDADHPMGTTRMSADPRHGVVDTDCRVHGVGNLYVAGSSVFPTGGNAPPTFTIACLALRVGDRLRQALTG
jgi:choline dehydrogenase-like flavoprotein